MIKGKQTLWKWLFISLLILFVGGGSWVIWYEIPPSNIQVRQVAIDEGEFEITGIARELIVQDVTEKGVWASRGYDIYFKSKEENFFSRRGRVPLPLGIPYLGNFRIIRQLMNKQEVLELLVHPSGNIIAFGGGGIFRSTDSGRSYTEVARVDHFGLGKGRGIMPQGYAVDAQGNIYWGEYWNNPGQKAVRLWKSKDGGSSWESVYIFPKDTIRHIHAVQYDPYFDAVWVATGDLDRECSIMYSTDGGSTFTQIGSGSQKWRAVSLLFTRKYVCWGMDGFSPTFPQMKIFCWDRVTGNTKEVAILNSSAFYSATLDNETLILSTSGEFGGGYASLWISRDGKSWVQASNWARKRENHFGTIRMVSNKNDLIISNVNLSYHNNDLLILQPH